ncbi:MAG: hypothetical protein H7Y17_13030 [Chlorobia bacterium]|nr:hypothetical protein [Fimbriimonadaceae bacterium]
MTRPVVPIWLLPCIALTALISGYSILQRHQAESKNKAITLAVEFETIESLAASQGTPIDKAIENLKAQGVTAVALGEETISELISEGYASISGNEVILRQDRTINSQKALEALADRVQRGLRERFPKAKVSTGQESGQIAIRVEFVSPSLIRQTAIGLNPSISQLVSQRGLDIICRMSNPQGASSQYVTNTVAWAKELGAKIFLPQGDQVLGRRDAIPDLVAGIKANGLLYASPEFTKIGGDANVVAAIPQLVVRLHSAQTAELDKLPLTDAIDRYAKAARERNMRVLLVRPVSYASQYPLESFASFLKSINDAIRSEGGDMGPAKPFEDSGVPIAATILIALSAIPTAYFVASALIPKRQLAIAATVLFGLVCIASVSGAGKAYAALLIAVLFPITAFLILDAREGKNILVEFLLVSAISLVGGLAVAGLLNGLTYFVKAQEFRGIKVAVFTPIIVAGWYFAARFGNLREAMKNPITWGAAFLSLGLLVAFMFMNARTGNDNPAGVSDLELKFRSVLDQFLFVRPRTKSFLIGHPMLIVGIGLLLWQRKTGSVALAPWTILCLTVGAVGQTDIVNTLCHLHTPVALSLIRNAVGLIPGCIIGFCTWGVVRHVGLKRMREN